MDRLSLDIAKSNALILIVDDDKDTRDLLTIMLKREGFRAEHAFDGIVAVQRALALIPDLILLDIQMPGMDGFGVLTELRNHPLTKRIPVVVISAAKREPDDIVRGLGLGADDYMLKPFTVAELLARVYSKIRARRLEDNLIERGNELEALFNISRKLSEGLNVDELAGHLLSATVDHFQAQQASLILLNGKERTLERFHGFQDNQSDPLAEGTLGAFVIKQLQPMIVENIDTHALVQRIFVGSPAASGLATPFIYQNELRGILILGHVTTQHFTANNLQLLRSIADQASLAIRNAQLYSQLQEYAHGLESMVEARTQQLQSTQLQLLRADKLAAVGTLAAGIAHEVNNPLQPILSSLEMALEDLDANRPVERELLEYAMKDVQRIKRIVSGLLDFARPGQSVQAPVDINSVLSEVLKLANKQLVVAGVKLKTELGEISRTLGSVDQLKQVFLNLVVNALEAMGEKQGSVLVVSTTEKEGFINIMVKDNGVGIPADKLPQIFDPFFTTKSTGTGLGLSVTHSIIEGMGGEIRVESTLGQGATFYLQLPIIKPTASTTSKAVTNKLDAAKHDPKPDAVPPAIPDAASPSTNSHVPKHKRSTSTMKRIPPS